MGEIGWGLYLEHDAARVREDAEAAVQVHAVLRKSHRFEGKGGRSLGLHWGMGVRLMMAIRGAALRAAGCDDAHLVLLKVVPDNPEAAGPEQVLVHQLLGSLHVGAEADAQEREVASGGKEVSALEEPGRLDFAYNVQTWIHMCRTDTRQERRQVKQ